MLRQSQVMQGVLSVGGRRLLGHAVVSLTTPLWRRARETLRSVDRGCVEYALPGATMCGMPRLCSYALSQTARDRGDGHGVVSCRVVPACLLGTSVGRREVGTGARRGQHFMPHRGQCVLAGKSDVDVLRLLPVPEGVVNVALLPCPRSPSRDDFALSLGS